MQETMDFFLQPTQNIKRECPSPVDADLLRLQISSFQRFSQRQRHFPVRDHKPRMPSDIDGPSMPHQSKKKRIEDDPLPADVGQKPVLLQRRRVWRACESCRRKKIKCDGCEPTCSQCATSGSQCTWLQTKDRAALSRHYVQELEARLLHMESLFAQITPVLEQLGHSIDGVNPPGSSSALSAPPSATNPLQTIISKDSSPAGTSPSPISPIKVEDDFSESFGQLALDEHGHMRWIGGSSTLSLIQSFRALTTSPLHRISPMEEDPRAPGPSVNKLYFPASVFFGKVHALPGPEDAEFPERDLADKLVDAYFLRFHFLMPVIDKPSFLRQYKALMNNVQDCTVTQTQTPFMALVFAVFACAATLIDDPRLATGGRQDEGGIGMIYYERALVLQYISHAHTQSTHVQCFILMSSFLCSVNCLPQAWILIGQAVRVGQDLGLHRSPRRLAITPIEKETRRKIWWGVYSLDRMLALALGRPLGVEDSDCDVEYPVDIDDDYLPEYFSGASISHMRPSLMTGSIALSTLYKIAGQVLRQVYAIDKFKEQLEPEKKVELQRTVESLDNDLTKWCEDLPLVFKSEPATEEQVSMGAVLCSHYYSVLTTLHRNFLPVKREQIVITPKSTVKAVSSARSCIRLAPSIKNVVPPSHHLAFFIQHLFSSAVILLLYAMHASEPRAAVAAMEEAKSSLGALESWEGHWPGARKCKELLIELTTTASEAIKEAAKGPDESAAIPATPHTIAPANLERRRSVTITTTPQGSVPGRIVKTKPRRPQSRDPNPSVRRAAAASPYRVDSQRARSTSRKRGHDESEAFDRTGRHISHYNTFSGPNTGRANNSPHSSPASVNLPSPAQGFDSPKEPSPRPQGGTSSYAYSVPISPVSPSLVSSSPRFDYDFGMSQNTVGKTITQQWNGNNGERRGLDMYPSSSSMTYPGSYGSPPSSLMESNYLTYDASSDMGGLSGLSTTPPTASFAAPGLPFRGLDYIRNYNPGVYSPSGDQDLWQSFDPGAFGYDPELPFVLSDFSVDPNESSQ